MAAGDASEKLPFIEKVGYSLGDFAAQFVFLTLVNFQSGFYTDAVGISPNAASFLVLITRLWDALFDPAMGFIADRTRTRWGRFRPWLIWTAIPWGVLMVLAFTVPPFRSYGATFCYALLTNMALWTIYSMNNTPYSALMAVMTGKQKERTSLSQYRFISAMIGQLIVGGFTLAIMTGIGTPVPPPPADLARQQFTAMTQPATTKMVIEVPTGADISKLTINDTPAMKSYKEIKQAHDADAWPKTMAIYAVICVICLAISFFTVRERITPLETNKDSEKTFGGKLASIGTDMKLLGGNGPWLVMFLVTVTHYVLSSIRGPAYNSYVNYVLDPEAMRQFLVQWHLPTIDPKADPNSLSLWYKFLNASKLIIKADNSNVPAVVYGLLQMTNKLWNVVGIIAASFLIGRFNKKLVVSLSLILNTVFILGLYAVPYNNIWGVYIVEWLGQLAYAPTVPLLWVLYADVCDYTEWKTGRNITGFIYATFFFGLKAGLSLGNFIGLQVMGFFGYKANEIQSDQSKLGILLTLTLIPGIFSVVCAVSMLFYQITKKMNNQIADDLTQRRAEGTA
ncbi:MAG TPA: MFS transporter [Phycisphaerae bacterium]|jgi:Na+/melibiose symporter-like transporter